MDLTIATKYHPFGGRILQKYHPFGGKIPPIWGQNTTHLGARTVHNTLTFSCLQEQNNLINILIKVLKNFNKIETAPNFGNYGASIYNKNKKIQL